MAACPKLLCPNAPPDAAGFPNAPPPAPEPKADCPNADPDALAPPGADVCARTAASLNSGGRSLPTSPVGYRASWSFSAVRTVCETFLSALSSVVVAWPTSCVSSWAYCAPVPLFSAFTLFQRSSSNDTSGPRRTLGSYFAAPNEDRVHCGRSGPSSSRTVSSLEA